MVALTRTSQSHGCLNSYISVSWLLSLCFIMLSTVFQLLADRSLVINIIIIRPIIIIIIIIIIYRSHEQRSLIGSQCAIVFCLVVLFCFLFWSVYQEACRLVDKLGKEGVYTMFILSTDVVRHSVCLHFSCPQTQQNGTHSFAIRPITEVGHLVKPGKPQVWIFGPSFRNQ